MYNIIVKKGILAAILLVAASVGAAVPTALPLPSVEKADTEVTP